MLFGVCKTLAAAALVACLGGAASSAPLRCPEGRTLSGECVNPVLAAAQRQQAIIEAQPKISLTAPIYLPSQDAFYPHALDHHEANVFYGGAVGRFYRRP